MNPVFLVDSIYAGGEGVAKTVFGQATKQRQFSNFSTFRRDMIHV